MSLDSTRLRDQHRLFRRRKPPAGAPPGATVTPRDLPAPRLAVIAYDREQLVEVQGQRLRDVLTAMQTAQVAWLDVQGLGDEAVIREIATHFDLHPLVVADILNLGQRPKVELYDDLLYHVVRMVMVTPDSDVHWEQFSVVVKNNVVLTFQETYGDCLDPVRQRIRQARPMIRGSGPDYLAVMAVDAIVDSYFPVVETYGEVLERLEDDLVRSPTPAVLRRVYRTKRELLKLRRATWPLRDALNHLLRDAPPMIEAKTLPYVRDVTDHVMQVVDIVETYRELAGSFVDVYLSSLAQRTNEVMRALTVLASIFIPLTFLAGVYGMNFHSMPELSWEWGYPTFWVICAVTTIALLVLFRRWGWIGARSGIPYPDADDA
ncbi:MAG: magnesium/cobalt transporter CorA [Planctomycetota bacterium]